LPIVVLVIPSVCNVASLAKETWFNQGVTWKYGSEGLAWKTTVRNPNGQAEYQFILQPLWAVEGGVVALEIVVARPKQPDVNLLGERRNGVEYPFVITVEELEKGLAHSKFGAVRNLHADDLGLIVKINRFRLGIRSGILLEVQQSPRAVNVDHCREWRKESVTAGLPVCR